MKFFRTVRFDDTDSRVFEAAALPSEWAVSGSFAFVAMDAAQIIGKTRQAFDSGFLGLDSFGRSTFVAVASIELDELTFVQHALAAHFVKVYGAPNVEAALPAACEETDFILDLCKEAPVNAVFSLQRRFDDDGQIRETFRTIEATADQAIYAPLWTLEEDDKPQ